MIRGGTIAACALLVSGCGFGFFTDEGERGGGADNLPTLGAGPYGKLPIDFDTPADEPFVFEDSSASLSDPTAISLGGDAFRVWFTRTPDNRTDSEIWVGELSSLTELPELFPTVVLAPTLVWEDDRVAAPSVIELPTGELVMYYEAGQAVAQIGRATSTDGGMSWTKHPEPLLSGIAPGAAFIDGEYLLYYTRPDHSGVFVARSTDGISFSLEPAAVLAARPTVASAYDSIRLLSPDPVARISPAGQLRVVLFVGGTRADGDDTVFAIGSAASLDGTAFTRFAEGEPIVTGGPPSELSPAVVLFRERGVMFYAETRLNRLRIAAALHP